MFKSLIPWRKKHAVHPSRGDLTAPPAGDLAQLRDRFDSLMDRFWGGESPWEDLDRWNVGWGCDLEDSDKEIVVRAEAPGFEPEEIDIKMSGDRLVMEAEHQEEAKKNGGSYKNRLYRSITLPRGIQSEDIKAEYKNGILEVHLPKGPDAQAKRIPVKAK